MGRLRFDPEAESSIDLVKKKGRRLGGDGKFNAYSFGDLQVMLDEHGILFVGQMKNQKEIHYVRDNPADCKHVLVLCAEGCEYVGDQEEIKKIWCEPFMAKAILGAHKERSVIQEKEE